MGALLAVEGLRIGFGDAPDVVSDVSFSLQPGETLALVGESGSGKTITCRSVLRILPGTAELRGGRILFGEDQTDLLTLSSRKMRSLRGNRIAMIFQEPMRSLSPLHRIGNQVGEVLRLHHDLSADAARRRVLETFEKVGFPDPDRAFRSYPFEMSGGMRQRAMIAMAMVSKPDLLIADEPTTALDVTTQAQVLGLIKDLQRDTGMGLILVTHDLGVVANMAEKVVVMNKGRVMEAGPAAPVLSEPAHGYTQETPGRSPPDPRSRRPRAAAAGQGLHPADERNLQDLCAQGVRAARADPGQRVPAGDAVAAARQDAGHRRRKRVGQDHRRPHRPGCRAARSRRRSLVPAELEGQTLCRSTT